MLENIFSNYKFKQLSEFFVKIKSEIIDEETKIECKQFSTKWTEINTKLKNELDLKILINENLEMDFVSFYLKKGLITLEQINFIMLNHNQYDFNRVIKHDYFIVNEDIATTFNSGYKFFDNDYILGWEYIRKLKFEYISRYAGIDNLANFSCHIDSSNNEILYKENSEVVKEKTINSVMAATSTEAYVKVLTKLNK